MFESTRRIPSVLALVLGCLLCATATSQERVALVIGNGGYLRTTPLKNPVNDATALGAVLKELDFEVLQSNDVTKEQFETQVASFVDLMQPAEIALFYYAGHGLQVDGKNYLIPIDFDLASEVALVSQLVSLDQILSRMSSEKRVNLVFLDACRDNPFASELKASLSGGRSLSVDGTRAVKVVGDGLAEVEGGVGTLIAFATQPGNVALDGAGEHSPFAEGLLLSIREPGLEVSNLLRNVRKHVYRETEGRQIPWDHSSLVEKYYFKKKKQRAAPPP